MPPPATPNAPEVSPAPTAQDRAIAELQERCKRIEGLVGKPELASPAPKQDDALSLIVFSGELDKLLAAFVIATGAAACGMKASIFFTFWGTTALRKARAQAQKNLVERAFGWLLPTGTRKLPLSRLNLGGAGARMMRSAMKQKGVASLEELLSLAAELDVQLSVCTMSMDLLGIQSQELIDYPNLSYCGVASYIQTASNSRISMII